MTPYLAKRNKSGTGPDSSAAPFSLEDTAEDIAMKKLAMLSIMLLAAGPVFAQSPAPSAPPAAKAANGSTFESRVDQRITQMHQRLAITSAQQPAWDAFAQVMRANATSTDQAYRERGTSIATMSAPDNMRNFAQIEQARAQGVQNLAAAFQTLYDGMSADQKQIADAMFRHYEDRGAARNKASK